MRAILPLALLALTACYTPRAVESGADPYDYGGELDQWGYAPLEASLYYDEYSGAVSFDLSRAANVAIFTLRPGGSLEMIYPAIGFGRRMAFSGGRHLVYTAESRVRHAADWSVAGMGQPMYILLVASEDALDVRSFRATRTMSWLNRSAVTYNPYVALDALVGEIVPRPTTSAWTTAMHVVWPMNTWPGARSRSYLRVHCANGTVVVVPYEAVVANYPVCPEHLEQPQDSASAGKPDEKVKKRAKPPEGWMTTRIGDTDVRKELERLRAEHGKRDPGPLAVRPFPTRPTEPRRGVGTRTIRPADDELGTRRTRPARPARPTVDRERRPSAPAARAPSRPASKPASRPSPPPKPTKPGGGGSGGSGGSGGTA